MLLAGKSPRGIGHGSWGGSVLGWSPHPPEDPPTHPRTHTFVALTLCVFSGDLSPIQGMELPKSWLALRMLQTVTYGQP